jgi:uncharacterized membrane protein
VAGAAVYSMIRHKLSRAAFFGACALCLAQAWRYYPLLPDRVASHFGPSGLPNAWMERGQFFGVYLGVVGLLTLAFLGLSSKFASFEGSDMKLPNKEYWLAPERRAETLQFMSGAFLRFGAGTLALMLDVFHQVFEFNLGRTKTLDHPLLSLAVYAAFTAVWVAAFHRRFSRKPSA